MERRRFGMRPGLEVMQALMAELGDPQNTLKYVHVAGTNGKGATTALVDAALRAAGRRVCRYTSPHLVTVNERFFVDGAPVADAALAAATDETCAAIARLEARGDTEVTFFEALTAVAFVLFARIRPDVVVLETGLGGRLDATNVVPPENVLVSVITRIGLDHCDWLGSTHAAIAEEKAGIIKPGRPVVCGIMPEAAKETIERFASLNGSEFVAVDDHATVAPAAGTDWARPVFTTARRNLPPIELALRGAYQVENALTALTVLDVLSHRCGIEVPNRAIEEGFADVVWPGRAQRLVSDGVTVIVDGAHNPDGAMALRESLRVGSLAVGSATPVALVAGFCGDKDVLAHLRIMSAIASTGWAVPIHSARSLDPAEVAERMSIAGFSSCAPCASLPEALVLARAWAKSNGGVIVVCGSLFLAGEALQELGAFPWPVFGVAHPNELTLH